MTDNLLKKIQQQEQYAKVFGFYWERIDQLLDQIRSECLEIEEAFISKNKAHLEEEIGDLMQAAISLAVFCNFDPEQTLSKSIIKFQNRYETLVQLVKNDGLSDLREQDFSVLNDYWQKAKK